MAATPSQRLSLLRGPLLLCGMAIVFLLVNWGNYQGYFQSDDLDNMTWAPKLQFKDYLEPLWQFRYEHSNFRPVGHYYYHVLLPWAGLNFKPWLAVVNAFHLLNVAMLWLVLRRLQFSRWASSAGAFFFAIHFSLADAFWKPMFVFDVLCETFLLLTFLLYARGHWLIGIVPFYLAYRSKELAILFPLVLLMYEFLFDRRIWFRLTPYFALSGWFGIKAILWQRHLAQHPEEVSYRLMASSGALWKTIGFYANHTALLSFGGILLVLLLYRVRDRRLLFGIVSFVLLLFPMLLLPGKTAAVYLYVPFTGMAAVIAVAAQHHGRRFAAIFMAVWLAVCAYQMRSYRAAELAIARDHRNYVADLDRAFPTLPRTNRFLFRGRPKAMEPWGISGAIEDLARLRGVEWTDHEVYDYEWLKNEHRLPPPPYVILTWDPASHHVQVTPQWQAE